MNVNVISPWYPDQVSIFLGTFVKQQVDAVRGLGIECDVEVPTLHAAPRGPVDATVAAAIARLGNDDPDAVYVRRDEAVWIPAPVPSGSGYAGRVNAFASALALKRMVLPTAGDVVHAHLGVPTAAAQLDLDDRPLVVTEHQSTIELVLAERRARDFYQAVLERAALMWVVSASLRDRISAVLGRKATSRIEVMPNIVDTTDIAFSPRERGTRRWLYVGGLLPHKGVRLLVHSFAHFQQTVDPAAELRLVGDGPMLEWITAFAAARGIDRNVELVGAVPHHQLAAHLADSDVFVHLSEAETFGIAALEAIAAGLPVVSLSNGGAESTWGPIAEAVGVILPPDASSADVADAVVRVGRSDSIDPHAGRDFVDDRYSAARVASLLADGYRSVL